MALGAGGCDRESAKQAQPQAEQTGTAPAAKLDRSKRGADLPPITVQDAAGKTLALPSLKGKPVLINLWNSVVRWELRTKLFLRTQEFWWQEGHTAHATHAEAQAETLQMLDVYLDFARNEAALTAYTGRKSASE